MKFLRTIFGLMVLLFSACSNDTSRPASEGTAPSPIGNQPVAHGKVNEVLVICDSSLWTGPIGDSFFYYFNAPYIILPTPEPIFDLKQMTTEGLARQPLNKEFRTIIFLADMNDEESSTTRLLHADIGPEKINEIRKGKGYNVTTGQDKWASSQQLFYISGFGQHKLVECIATNFSAIAQSINEKDQAVIRAITYKDGEEYEIQDEVLKKYGLHLKLPKGFEQVGFDAKSNTMLLHKNDYEHDIGYYIRLRKLISQGNTQLSEQDIKKIREETASMDNQADNNISGFKADMKLPIFVESKLINGTQAMQARGVWRNGNFTGPFVSNLLHNPKTNELIFFDGFTIDKMGGKRDPIQILEVEMSSASF